MLPMTNQSNSTANTASRRKVDIIWNMTLICPWDCAACCVSAVQVTKRKDSIIVKSEDLTRTEAIPYDREQGSIYEQVLKMRQKAGKELGFDSKLRIIDHLDGFNAKVDFSGGDSMVIPENLEVLRIASQRLGKKQVTLTATGAALARYEVDEIAPFIGELNFTYDNISPEGNSSRPAGYATGNLRKATAFAKAGVLTRGECPLTVQNVDDSILRQLYINLHEAGIQKLLLMRLFPVGRGTLCPEDIPTPQQYRRAIYLLRLLESEFGYPQVKLQCALKFFDNQSLSKNPCDLLHESFGLMADGTLLTSPWAINAHGKPLDESWVIGNLSERSMGELLASRKAFAYQERLDENFGHCKIFSFLNSKRVNSFERIFDKTDPLYMAAIESNPISAPFDLEVA